MTKKFSLKPYPIGLVITNNEKYFEAENTCDLIGFADRCGTQILMAINPAQSKATQLEAIVHEAVHTIQYVEEIIEGRLDKETEAYLTEHIFGEACKLLKLFPR